jgi:Holliday junction resolvase
MPSESDLRRLIRKNLPQVNWTTIESRYTESGIPDLNGCYAGADFWIECKVTKAYAVVLRPAQIAWIDRRIRAGGKVWIAIRRYSKKNKVDELWLVNGGAVRELNEYGLRGNGQLPGVGFPGGPGEWPWKKILHVLT